MNFWEGDERASFNLQAIVISEVECIDEVTEWIWEHRAGCQVELFVEAERALCSFEVPRKAKLIKLYGTNPNEDR